MFRRDPRDPLERQLSQLRHQLEQTALEEDLTPDEELPPPVPSDVAVATPRTTWQPSETPSRVPTPAPTDRLTSIVAANARWEGTLQTEGSLVIHGQVQGTIRATHDVTIAEGAAVEAEIVAHDVAVHGTVRGRIEARGRLEIHPTGQVVGEVQAPSLVVHEGARLSGKLKMGSSDAGEAQG
ncbi:MAG: polymer-forming cytoskeletal protein [Thermomicrobium sp.]|nr:polymer-forming cytoskeletal protein [Thermomicrobium sp.]MDW7982737.1 polymer-forming cytoskeletal protein [Thermomicrobium sp.]